MQEGPWKLEVHTQYVVPLVEFSTQVPPLAQAGEQVVVLPLEATTPARSPDPGSCNSPPWLADVGFRV